jgi:hypothetical protein
MKWFIEPALEKVFIGGISALGLLSVAAGFVNDKIPIIILRALIGIGKTEATEVEYLC